MKLPVRISAPFKLMRIKVYLKFSVITCSWWTSNLLKKIQWRDYDLLSNGNNDFTNRECQHSSRKRNDFLITSFESWKSYFFVTIFVTALPYGAGHTSPPLVERRRNYWPLKWTSGDSKFREHSKLTSHIRNKTYVNILTVLVVFSVLVKVWKWFRRK